MNTEIIVTSIDGVIEIKHRQKTIVFSRVELTDPIKLKAQEIIAYVESLKTPEDKVAIALDFIKANAAVEQKLTLIEIYPKWEPLVGYLIGDEIQYNGSLYKVVQAHTSQSDWAPDTVPALFTKIVPPGVIPNWVQPTGAQDAYKIGDKVKFEGKTYESLIKANTWSPTGYPAGWKLIS